MQYGRTLLLLAVSLPPFLGRIEAVYTKNVGFLCVSVMFHIGRNGLGYKFGAFIYASYLPKFKNVHFSELLSLRTLCVVNHSMQASYLGKFHVIYLPPSTVKANLGGGMVILLKIVRER